MSYQKKIKNYFFEHKIISSLLILIILYGAYATYQSRITSINTQKKYVVNKVTKDSIVITVTGSGQVGSSNQVEIKSKISGDNIILRKKAGDEVERGMIIAEINSKDARKSLRDAEANLENSKLSLEKLKQPADNLSLIQSDNNLKKSEEEKQTAEANIKKIYEDSYNGIANAFLDIPTIITGLQDILYGSNISNSEWNISYYSSNTSKYEYSIGKFKDEVVKKNADAVKSYTANFEDYKKINRSGSKEEIESLLNETYETSKVISEAIKSTNNLIQLYQTKLSENNQKPIAISDAHLTSLNSYTGKINNHLSNILSFKESIISNQNNSLNADRSIKENIESLAKLKSGADPLDIKSAELAVKQKENALEDAKEKLNDYFIIAPFTGVLAKINIKNYDSVGNSTSIATLITKQKITEISLNEVDVSKIKIGQKATITFDAIDNLQMAGKVTEIDTLGTVSQGVVTYTVKISLDTDDERIKSGMSVNANIIVDIKQDILVIPNSAIKQKNGDKYIETITEIVSDANINKELTTKNPIIQKNITTGLVGDISSEIISGLNEGDKIITKTITPSSAITTTQAPSLFGNIGGGRGLGGGNNNRTPSR